MRSKTLYVANMHQGIEALQSHDLGRARDLLQRIERSPQQRSMRGWEWRYLKQHCRSDEMFTLGRHDSWVAALAVSPDRQRAGGDDLERGNSSADQLGCAHEPVENSLRRLPACAHIYTGRGEARHCGV
jgi:hypothetical protein